MVKPSGINWAKLGQLEDFAELVFGGFEVAAGAKNPPRPFLTQRGRRVSGPEPTPSLEAALRSTTQHR
ncbi:hypothetical protein CSOJ01_00810 [Colletotrichum sojae]|uniref:Uncharacterized protein n=1 Tax=Colletotrichum sojae TaxID=2175907 RepID=A0A8H6JW94_9PEZI|nr:hypothetical protein CSOJ01_00810 [Colletotrichum sojae]